MPRFSPSTAAALATLALWIAPAARLEAQGQTTATAETAPQQADRAPPLPKELLADPALIAKGDAIWKEQCTHCHGSKAYPGKAPKLTPRRYTPEFVWDRVHNGFRGMPSWKDVYSPEEVIGIVAYVLSDEFWP